MHHPGSTRQVVVVYPTCRGVQPWTSSLALHYHTRPYASAFTLAPATQHNKPSLTQLSSPTFHSPNLPTPTPSLLHQPSQHASHRLRCLHLQPHVNGPSRDEVVLCIPAVHHPGSDCVRRTTPPLDYLIPTRRQNRNSRTRRQNTAGNSQRHRNTTKMGLTTTHSSAEHQSTAHPHMTLTQSHHSTSNNSTTSHHTLRPPLFTSVADRAIPLS